MKPFGNSSCWQPSSYDAPLKVKVHDVQLCEVLANTLVGLRKLMSWSVSLEPGAESDADMPMP